MLQLQGVLTQRESKVSALEDELKQLREHVEQQKSTVSLLLIRYGLVFINKRLVIKLVY